jgi:hypothetical protein
MASAKLTKALAERRIILRKSPRVAGEVMLSFRPILDEKTGRTRQPASISIGWRPVEPLRRTDVTFDNIRNSNLGDLVARRAVTLL